MITCKLYGRLGNQMFQIAATIGLAIKHNTKYAIPSESIDSNVFPTYFTHFPKFENNGKVLNFYEEKGHPYQEIPYNNSENLCLNGYFQSEKYFKHCRKEIIEAFGFRKPCSLNDYVSIHVRRGDYLNHPTKHPVVTNNYLKNAIEYFLEKRFLSKWYNKFLVFSDDIPWCKENLNGNIYKDATFEYSENNTELNDLILQSECQHNIIANSSFSWWAGWLNQNPNKIVIAPKTWFGPDNAHLDTKDLIPETWIKF